MNQEVPVNEMESKLNIESITNGLLTLQRLKQLYDPAQRDGSGHKETTLQPDRLALLQGTLNAITDFVPAARGPSFSEAFRMGNHYSTAYRGIKQHFREMGRGGKSGDFDAKQLLKTMKVVYPVLGNREKVYLEKVIKIFDVLGS